MKKLVFALSLLAIGMNAFAGTSSRKDDYLSYNFNYSKYGDRNCSNDIMACDRDESPIDFSSNKNLMTADQLNNIIARDKQRSVFIPLELTNTELITLTAATSLGVIAFKNDQEITDVLQRNNSQIAQTLTSVGNLYGSGYGFSAIAAGSYFLGMYYDNDKLKKVGLFIVGAEVAQAIVTEAVKRTFSRDRPTSGVGPYQFFDSGNKSFWSGHSATAFVLATVVSEMYKEDYPIIPYVAYGAAAITAYARVYENHHWASDVIMGAIAGHLIAKLAISSFNDDGTRGGLTFYPGFDPKSGMITANIEWTPKYKEGPLKCASMPDGELKIRACFEESIARSEKKKIFR